MLIFISKWFTNEHPWNCSHGFDQRGGKNMHEKLSFCSTDSLHDVLHFFFGYKV